MEKVQVNASKQYEVLIGHGILSELGRYLRERLPAPCAAVISDTTVAPLYAGVVEQSLQDAGLRTVRFAFPPGEEHKTLSTASDILEFLAQQRLTRGDCIVALGGGIPGDVAGFCAASYLRGIPFVQVPTTFLAAIDSSVGGKTAVNLSAGKNLAGAFWQPSLVVCDCDTFRTLPQDVFASGIAEGIKTGAIADAELFSFFAQQDIHAFLPQVISRCVSIKAAVVAADEYDRGRRQLLNFGHTLGHAIEKCSCFSIPHGQAIGIGMILISRAAYKMGFSEEDLSPIIRAALEKYGLPTQAPYTLEELLPYLLADKKRMGEKITLVLPRKIGCCEGLTVTVSQLPDLLAPAFSKQEG